MPAMVIEAHRKRFNPSIGPKRSLIDRWSCSIRLFNAVLVGGTGTGKTHLAIAIARSCIRSGVRGRFYNVVDLVNRLETETRNGRQGRLADHLTQ